MAELVYAYVSEAYGEILGGSSPPLLTLHVTLPRKQSSRGGLESRKVGAMSLCDGAT